MMEGGGSRRSLGFFTQVSVHLLLDERAVFNLERHILEIGLIEHDPTHYGLLRVFLCFYDWKNAEEKFR